MKNYKTKSIKIALSFLSALFLFISCKSEKSVILCGGGEEFSCPVGYFCKLYENCGGIDQYGECAYIPDNCSNKEESVCGCNKKTYTNACYANAAMVSVAYQGACIGSSNK